MNTKDFTISKLLIGVLIGIVGIWIIGMLIPGMGYGANFGFRGYHDGGHMYWGYGVGSAGTFSFLLLFLIKILFVLFIVGLVVGIAFAARNYLFTNRDTTITKHMSTGVQATAIKETCVGCGKELESNWKVCPFCGKEVKPQVS